MGDAVHHAPAGRETDPACQNAGITQHVTADHPRSYVLQVTVQ